MNVIMDPEIQRILEEAKRLPPLRRAALAVSILESLEEESDPDAEKAWDEVANRRLEELESGRVRALTSDDLRKALLRDAPPPRC